MVHLTEQTCRDDILSCFGQWLLKTTTAFHNDENLNLPSCFGVFCCNYAVAGFVLLKCRPLWINQTNFPYTAFAWTLILVQAPLSFYADYIYMDSDSVFHVLDRFLAVPCFGLDVWNITLLWRRHTNRTVVWLRTMLLFSAMCAFLQSQHAQSQQNRIDFIFWHNLWHLYPLLASILTLYDYYLSGNSYKKASWSWSMTDTAPRPQPPYCDGDSNKVKLPVLLSSLLVLESQSRINNNKAERKAV